jgi:hypothetical protein
MKRAATGLAILALAFGCGAPRTTRTEGRPVLPFVEDDYASALSDAKARKLPIFVEVWAPW